MVMEMINAAEVREGDPNFKSALDLLFDELESEDPQSIALKQYKVFKQAQDKTAKSILIGAAGPAWRPSICRSLPASQTATRCILGVWGRKSARFSA